MPSALVCDRESAGHVGPLWEIVGSVFRAYQQRKTVGFVFVLSSVQGWEWLITMGLSASAWDAHFVSCCLWLVIMQVLMSEVSAAAGWGTGASAEGVPCLGVLVCEGQWWLFGWSCRWSHPRCSEQRMPTELSCVPTRTCFLQLWFKEECFDPKFVFFISK